MPPYALAPLTILNEETVDQLLTLWAGAVRASHDFLTAEDIAALRPQVREALKVVDLLVARDEAGRPMGFAGTAGDKLEMLFVAAGKWGRGVGKALLARVLDQGIILVDANEQNPAALGFYRKMGFEIVGRSERDGQGRPFPLLHLRLKNFREKPSC